MSRSATQPLDPVDTERSADNPRSSSPEATDESRRLTLREAFVSGASDGPTSRARHEARGDAEPRGPRPEPAARAQATGVEGAPPPSARKSGKKKVVLGLVGLLVLMAAIGFGAHWWLVGRYLVSTDDAYVGADIAQISARVAGRVESVPVAANQYVAQGTPVVVLDTTDYRLALDQAKAKLQTQEASVGRIASQIEAAKAAVTQARAQRDSAAAEVRRAEADFKRIAALASNQYNSVASLDTARANRDKAQAALESATAGIRSAEANVAVLEAQKTEAERTLAELRVSVDKAQWDLDATVVRAPFDGVVGNKSVQVGDYVTAGKRLAALVPEDAVYIDANFKETQLAGIRPGAVAHISVDAAGGATIDSKVLSIAPATGSQFSLLPPENATGNFTKIVQRVPVRISVPRSAVEEGILRPGLSVVATVDIRTGGEAKKSTPAETPAPEATARAPRSESIAR
ncbi:MAG: HlyD family secretion protein [Hyphomicrobiaceae bacterium]